MSEPGPWAPREKTRSASLARPYSWTEGRTRPTVELAVEALVQATTEGGAVPYHSANPGSMVIELCRQPRSVAEVAALMAVPLGVARVLIGDLIEAGYVDVRSTLSENATWDQRHELLERVLGGLRKL